MLSQRMFIISTHFSQNIHTPIPYYIHVPIRPTHHRMENEQNYRATIDLSFAALFHDHFSHGDHAARIFDGDRSFAHSLSIKIRYMHWSLGTCTCA